MTEPRNPLLAAMWLRQAAHPAEIARRVEIIATDMATPDGLAETARQLTESGPDELSQQVMAEVGALRPAPDVIALLAENSTPARADLLRAVGMRSTPAEFLTLLALVPDGHRTATDLLKTAADDRTVPDLGKLMSAWYSNLDKLLYHVAGRTVEDLADLVILLREADRDRDADRLLELAARQGTPSKRAALTALLYAAGRIHDYRRVRCAAADG